MKNQKKAVSEYFSTNVNSWHERYGKVDFESASYQDRMRAALTLLSKNKKEQPVIWDAGCGAGILSKELIDRNYKVFACDISTEMAQQTLTTIANPETSKSNPGVFVSDLEQQPIRDCSIDAIISLGVIGYSEKQELIISDFLRSLKPDGLLIISIATERKFNEILSDIFSYIPDRIYMGVKNMLIKPKKLTAQDHNNFYKSHYYYSTSVEFDQLLNNHGMEKVDSIAVNFGRFHFIGKRFLPESIEIKLNKLQTRISGLVGFRWLQDYSRIYVGCYKPRKTIANNA